jgi:hypothetical protein
MINACKILVGNPEGKRPHKNRGIDGRIVLNLIFAK